MSLNAVSKSQSPRTETLSRMIQMTSQCYKPLYSATAGSLGNKSNGSSLSVSTGRHRLQDRIWGSLWVDG